MKIGRLARLFHSLGLLETTELFYYGQEQLTFHKGRHQIDAVWVSPLLYPYASSMASFYLGVGNYRIFIVDFPLEVVMGSRFILICRPFRRCLILCQPKSVSNYIKYSEFLFKYYRIKEKLDSIEDDQASSSVCDRERYLNKIDSEYTQLLFCSEKKCRKLCTRAVEYSPILSKLSLHWRFLRKVTYYK